MLETIATLVVAYLLGAVPTAYLVGRRLASIDIREAGSHNPGALNIYRRVGRLAGLAVLSLDAAKGALAVYVGILLNVPDTVVFLAAGVATIGHNFSPFLGFKGGKGAAVVLGVSAVMLWELTAIATVGGLVFLALTRNVVLSMAAAFVLLNGLAIGTSQPGGQIVLCLVLSFLVGGTHLLRQHPRLLSALRRREWRRLVTIE